MRKNMLLVLIASTVAACSHTPHDLADRGVDPVNTPVLNRSTYAIDLSAPGGILAPLEVARLDGWFRTLGLGYGDSIYVDGFDAGTATAQVAELAGNYGMMVLPAAPVTAGAVPAGTVRVVVSRNRAEVPGCPNWSVPSQPNFQNRSMSNFGCAVNTNFALQVANPEDLFHGREGNAVGDAVTATKAVTFYRTTPPTGTSGLQDISTKKDKN